MAAATTTSRKCEYDMFCAAGNCDSKEAMIRCPTCELFAFCKSHQGSNHTCLPRMRETNGRQLPLSTLLDCFRALSNLPEPNPERVRHIRVYPGPPPSWEEAKDLFGTKACKAHAREQLRIAFEHSSRLGSSILLVEFMPPANSSTTVLMRPREIDDSPPRTFQIQNWTIPQGASWTMGDAPSWTYGDCLVCGHKDKTVWQCSQCGLPVHSQCSKNHTAACKNILPKKWDEGHDVSPPPLEIANYLCREIRQLPRNSRVLGVNTGEGTCTFLNFDEITKALRDPFAQRVRSIVAHVPGIDRRLIIAIDGESPAQQKVMILTSTASNCTIM